MEQNPDGRMGSSPKSDFGYYHYLGTIAEERCFSKLSDYLTDILNISNLYKRRNGIALPNIW
jgi:hypothetical protein